MLGYQDIKIHGANLGPVGPRWDPCWPQKPCYQGRYRWIIQDDIYFLLHNIVHVWTIPTLMLKLALKQSISQVSAGYYIDGI